MICRYSAAYLLSKFLENASQVVAVFTEGHARGVRFYVHNEIQCVAVQSERHTLMPVGLTRPPLQPISNICLSDFLRGGDTEPRIGKIVRGEKENAISGEKFATRLVDSQKIATLHQPSLVR